MSRLSHRPLIARTHHFASMLPAITVLTASTAFAADITSVWVGPATGAWSNPAFWAPAMVPNNGGGDRFDVVIDGLPRQGSTVTLAGTYTIDDLVIGVGDALFINNGSQLTLAGSTFGNAGTVRLNSAGGTTDMTIASDYTFSGAGAVAGSNTVANRVYGAVSTVRLTNAADHTIEGSMRLGESQLRLTNHGLINATTSSGIIVDLTDAGPNYNTGTFRASNGATLNISPASIDNTGGVIESGVGSFVSLNGCTIIGGTLRDTDGPGGGAVRNGSTCVLSGVAVDGEFNAPNGTSAYITGSIDIDGAFRLNSQGGTTDAVVQSQVVTVTGAAPEFVGSNTTANRLYGAASTHHLIMPANGVIRGAMQLGVNQMSFTNHGTVDADASAGLTLDLTDAGPNSNFGTLRASNGATLNISPASIDNTGGVIESGAGSFVSLNGCTIIGGTLRDTDGPGGGAVRNGSTCVLSGVSIDGEFNAANGTSAYITGSIDIDGAFRLNSQGGTTDVVVQSPVVTVTGAAPEFAGSNTTANRIYGAIATHRLVTPANGVIRGSLQLGANQLLLTNHGTVDADASVGVTLDLTDAGPNHNPGTLRASNAATLNISPAIIDNSGGVIEAGADSFVSLAGCTIIGGTLRDSDGEGGGHVRTQSIATLAGVTIDGGYRCGNGSTTYLSGSILLNGPLNLASQGGATDVVTMTTPFTLTGPGGTIGTSTQSNRIYALTTGHEIIIGSGHTVSGSVQLGVNLAAVRNEGTILANAAAGITIDPHDAGGFTNTGIVHLTTGNMTIGAGNFSTEGFVRVDQGRTLSRAGQYLQVGGTTRIDGALNASTGVALQGGTFGGAGQVPSPVNNTGGTVAPGNGPGTLALTQGYTQGNGGTLNIEIGGTTPGSEHDRLAVTGNAALAGALTVARIGGFIPTNGQTFVVLTTTGTRTGTFETLNSCDPITVTYGPQSVTIEFIGEFDRVGDLNHDGTVNGADLGMLLASWGACVEACCTGDINGDGIVNGADLGTLLANWG